MTTFSSANPPTAPRKRMARTAIVFLFPGQGAQHAGMARGLYDTEPVFAEHFDACAAGFRDEMGIDLHAEVFGEEATQPGAHRPLPTRACSQWNTRWASWSKATACAPGRWPDTASANIVAATLAGVFDLPTAIKAVSMRARLMHESAPGAMVAVALSPDAIAEYLSGGVDLSAVNDPGNCVVAGSPDEIRAFTARLREHGIPARRVRTAHAFHSSAMDPVAAGIPGLPVRSAASRTTHAAAQQPHRNLDDRRAGDRSGDLGTPDPRHGPLRRRTRRDAERSEPDPGRSGSRRQPDGLGDPAPEVVERAPRRPAHAPPGSEHR